MISWWRKYFGEEEIAYIAKSIRNEHISLGPVTAELEQKLSDILGIPYVVATTSGSMALLMVLMAAGIGPGDEVIVPNRTWIATAHAPLLLGAKAVLADVQVNSPIMDVTQIEENIGPRTKAIIPVHLNGRSVDMDEVNRIATEHNLLVIEDAAQAFCSANKTGFLGCQSFAGCFSFSVAKLISTGQGGFVVTRDKETYEILKSIRTHGVSDLIDVSYKRLGYNFRITDIQASIGIAQLDRLPGNIVRVKEIYYKYSAALHYFSFLKLIPVDVEAGEIPLYIEVLCPEREKLIGYLADYGIETRSAFPDLNLATHLKSSNRFQNSEIFGSQGLYLPCGPDQPLENIDRVITVLRKYGERQ